MEAPVYHIPALLDECINGLNIKSDGVYADVTFGGGGHSRAIMSKLGENGRLLGFDQDIDAFRNKLDDSRFTFVHGNFSFLKNFVRYYGIDALDGILADLGVSFHHFDDGERGFSFRQDSRLDMRMNQKATVDAATVLATYSEEQLASVLYLYGELKQSRRMASAIVKARSEGEIDTTARLTQVVMPFIRKSQEKKELAQVFQALRIEVNHEIDALKSMLQQSLQVLKPGGRLVVITYHSLEDRLVKNFMRSGNFDGEVEKDFYGNVLSPMKPVSRGALQASDAETASNSRARSARLRVAEKVDIKKQTL